MKVGHLKLLQLWSIITTTFISKMGSWIINEDGQEH
jgi:hypothetical protein